MHTCPKCSHQWEEKDVYFQTVFDYLSEKIPTLWMRANPAMIHMWKEAGYSFDGLVKPAIDTALKSGKSIGLQYINSIIQNSLKTPMAPVKQESKVDPYTHARLLKQRKKWTGFINERDEATLNHYESQHGVISL